MCRSIPWHSFGGPLDLLERGCRSDRRSRGAQQYAPNSLAGREHAAARRRLLPRKQARSMGTTARRTIRDHRVRIRATSRSKSTSTPNGAPETKRLAQGRSDAQAANGRSRKPRSSKKMPPRRGRTSPAQADQRRAQALAQRRRRKRDGGGADRGRGRGTPEAGGDSAEELRRSCSTAIESGPANATRRGV